MAPKTKFYNVIQRPGTDWERDHEMQDVKIAKKQQFTFCEIAYHIFAAVKSISHHPCSSP